MDLSIGLALLYLEFINYKLSRDANGISKITFTHSHTYIYATPHVMHYCGNDASSGHINCDQSTGKHWQKSKIKQGFNGSSSFVIAHSDSTCSRN